MRIEHNLRNNRYIYKFNCQAIYNWDRILLDLRSGNITFVRDNAHTESWFREITVKSPHISDRIVYLDGTANVFAYPSTERVQAIVQGTKTEVTSRLLHTSDRSPHVVARIVAFTIGYYARFQLTANNIHFAVQKGHSRKNASYANRSHFAPFSKKILMREWDCIDYVYVPHIWISYIIKRTIFTSAYQ